MTFTHYMASEDGIHYEDVKKCIKSDCKDIIILLKNYFFKWNQRILKEMHHGFYKNIEQHNCFQHWQW